MEASTTSPLITVVIPTYNRKTSVVSALESVLCESDDDLQVVVVDDGSTDGTCEAFDELLDPRVRLIRQENRGVSAARNAGLAAAEGESFSFLDSDDLYLPGWWAEISSACRGGEVDLWSCSAQLRHQDDRVDIEQPRPLGPAFGGVEALYLAGTFAVRRRHVTACGGYLDGLRYGENTALGLALGSVFESGAVVKSTTRPFLRVDRRPRPYDAALLHESGTRVLEVFAHRLALDPQVSADAHAVAGWAAVRSGHRLVGIRRLFRSWKQRPFDAKRLLRLLVGFVRPTDASLQRTGRRLRGWRRLARTIRQHPSNRGSQLSRWWAVLRFELSAIGGRSVDLRFAERSVVSVRKQGDSSSRVVFARLPDWPEMEFWRRLLRPGDLFVDVGANVGLYSMIAAECGAEVIAFEPAADMAAACERNLARNRVKGTVVRAAVADRSGRTNLAGPDPNRRRLVLDAIGDDADTVDVVRLDDALASRAPTGIKVDVEGFERLVVQGGIGTLASPGLRAVQLEWNDLSVSALGEDREPLAQELFAVGLRLFQCRVGTDRYVEHLGVAPPFGPDVIATSDDAVAELLLASPWSSVT